MKHYLLDTPTLIWALTNPRKISKQARLMIESPEITISINAVSFWEISLKFRLGKLIIDPYDPSWFPMACKKLNFTIEPLEPEITSTFFELPILNESHKDPFDRILIWTAIKSNRTLISKDSSFKIYEELGLKTLW